MNIKLTLISLLTLVLAGCAALSMQFKLFSEPKENEPQARLRVLANGFVKAIPNKSCIDWDAPGAGTVFGGIVGSSGFKGRSIGMDNPRGYRAERAAELYVAAGKPLVLAFSTGQENMYVCQVAGTFVPEENKEYEAELILSESNRKCQFTLREIGEKERSIRVEYAGTCGR